MGRICALLDDLARCRCTPGATLDVVNITIRRKTIAAAVALSTASLSLIPALSASALPKAPGTLTVKRTGDNLQQLDIVWKAVPGVDHYAVTVYDGQKDDVKVVDANTTELVVDAPGACTRYQVRVAAVDASGSASTGIYRVPTLAPGGVQKLQSDRSSDGKEAKAFWAPPQFPGSGASPYYVVELKELASGKIIRTEKTEDTAVGFDGLEPKRMYAAKVTATNEFGSCITGTSLIRNQKPAAPSNVRVYRDGGSPSIVIMEWDAPEWNGYGKLEGYQIFVRRTDQKKAEVFKVGVDSRAYKWELDSEKSYTFQIRAFGSDGVGDISRPITLVKDGGDGSEEVDPKVKITEDGQVVGVTFTGVVGSSKKYPQMKLDISPTVGKGFSDSHIVSNGAGSLSFGKVPCGVYTVIVTGFGASEAKEFGRQGLNLCNSGGLDASSWRKVFGQADIEGNVVDMHYGNETRVLSTLKRESTNVVFTTQATLREGTGYGLWTRASAEKNGNKISGYSFEYDPGNKRMALRLWEEGKQCTTALAKVDWPSGLEVNATHKVSVVHEGDTYYAAVDGVKVFDVVSLEKAVEKSKCDMDKPEGKQVGFRTWNAKTSAVFENSSVS